MANKRTLKKPGKSKKNMKKTIKHNPLRIFEKMSMNDLYEELAQCLKDKDSDSFKELLWAYLKVHDKKAISRKMGVSRTTLYRMVSDEGNPTLSNIVSLLEALEDVA